MPDGGHPDAVVGGEIVSGEEVMKTPRQRRGRHRTPRRQRGGALTQDDINAELTRLRAFNDATMIDALQTALNTPPRQQFDSNKDLWRYLNTAFLENDRVFRPYQNPINPEDDAAARAMLELAAQPVVAAAAQGDVAMVPPVSPAAAPAAPVAPVAPLAEPDGPPVTVSGDDLKDILRPHVEQTAQRASTRLARRRQADEEVARVKAAAAAAAAAKAAEAKAAEEAAAKAATTAASTTVKSIVKTFGEDRDTLYLTASQALLPIMMEGKDLRGPVNGNPDNFPGTITFTQIFTPGEGVTTLTPACKAIYGTILSRVIRDEKTGSDQDIRKFFEIENPPLQCGPVLKGLTGPIETHCWLCGTKLVVGEQYDCEHRLSILLALCFTGLYDPILYGILYRIGRADEYIKLLRHEYAQSHAHCNRQKKDIPVLDARVDGATKRVTVSASKGGIREIINKISSSANYKPRPTAAEVQAALKTERLWDGKFTTQTLALVNPAATLGDREPVIAESLARLIEKINAQSITAKELCMRLTRSFLLRAMVLAPTATRATLYDDLPQEYQIFLDTTFPAAGGSRGKGLSGGAPEDKGKDYKSLYEIVEFVARCRMVDVMAAVFHPDIRAPSDDAVNDTLRHVDIKFDKYTTLFRQITDRAFERSAGPFFTSASREVGIDLLFTKIEELEDTSQVSGFIKTAYTNPAVAPAPAPVAAAASTSALTVDVTNDGAVEEYVLGEAETDAAKTGAQGPELEKAIRMLLADQAFLARVLPISPVKGTYSPDRAMALYRTPANRSVAKRNLAEALKNAGSDSEGASNQGDGTSGKGQGGPTNFVQTLEPRPVGGALGPKPDWL